MNKAQSLLGFMGVFLMAMPIMNAQEIGLQLYSFRNQFKTDVEGTLKTIQQLGIRKIEGGDTYGMPAEDFMMRGR